MKNKLWATATRVEEKCLKFSITVGSTNIDDLDFCERLTYIFTCLNCVSFSVLFYFSIRNHQKRKFYKMTSLLRQQNLIKSFSSTLQMRLLSSQLPAAAIEYKNAKPFEKIPGPRSFFDMMRLFALPGGKFYNKPLGDMLQLLRKEYGDICYFPGLLGQKPMVMTYKPEDAEKVYRAEGRYPYRRPLESFVYYRRNFRQDIFKTSGGLTVE
jgi:hypothetical protein